MNLKIITWIFLTLTTTFLFGQSIKKCDGTILLSISEKVGKLNKEEIKGFLLAFGKECRANVEFSEWSNELLFSVLDKQTDLTLKTIEEEENKIEMDNILDYLSSPISDMIVIGNLIPRIEKTKINNQLKRKIVDRLKTAEGKSN